MTTWNRGESDRADCDDCDWETGTGSDRAVLAMANDHVRALVHSVTIWREVWRALTPKAES